MTESRQLTSIYIFTLPDRKFSASKYENIVDMKNVDGNEKWFESQQVILFGEKFTYFKAIFLYFTFSAV